MREFRGKAVALPLFFLAQGNRLVRSYLTARMALRVSKGTNPFPLIIQSGR